MLLNLAKRTSINIKNSPVTEKLVNNNIYFSDHNNIDINGIDHFVISDDIITTNNNDTVRDNNLSNTINNNTITDNISFEEHTSPRAVECILKNITSENVDQSQADDPDNNFNNIWVLYLKKK